jgi:indolepyruvate ferredoxin oxidoreductase alpha subunit
MKKPVIMTGNEAIARGAYEAGCLFAAAYPGTPSTEILENMAQYREVDSRWASNEKVALEIVAGTSIGGARSLATMKHVGVNVAADPLFTMGYAGVNGGMVVISADDPGCHSSQNEQDNRLYAPLAKLAMIEPSDSQECKDYMLAAFEISEKFDVPVLFRVTTRVCHSKSIVQTGERSEVGIKPYVANPGKFAMLPSVARVRHAVREQLLIALEEYANTSPLNRIEWGNDRKIGVITSGISYQYARDVFGDSVSYLKLGLTNPMPSKLIRTFARSVDRIYIIEEGEPYIENKVRTLGFDCIGKERIPITGELSTGIVRKAFVGGEDAKTYTANLAAPPRPPVLCAGCPHRGFFRALHKRKKELVGVGDIGCYALGVNEPFFGFDFSICMGSGFSASIGFAKALERDGDTRKVFGMLGDSTFFHSGITGLVDAIHSQANLVLCILDNSTTAMTGHQEHPGTAVDLMGNEVPVVDIMRMVRATGIEDSHIRVVDPVDVDAMDAAVNDGIAAEGPFIIVTKRPCALIKSVARANAGKYCVTDLDKCKKCKACLKIACPAISNIDGVISVTDYVSCTACGLCMQVCKFDAISKVGE